MITVAEVRLWGRRIGASALWRASLLDWPHYARQAQLPHTTSQRIQQLLRVEDIRPG